MFTSYHIVDNSGVTISTRLEKALERVLTQGVSHFLGWQE